MCDELSYPMRLQKYLARAGVASRRNSEIIISEGRVSIDGMTITQMGYKVESSYVQVCVDGTVVSLPQSNQYIMLNKPAGFLTTMSDPFDRPNVSSLVPVDEYPSLFPVGRLDKDTTGLLLFTTDGELAEKLLHPKRHVNKTYKALVDGAVSERDAQCLREGIQLDDGMTLPARVKIEAVGKQSILSITIHEGRKRQIKRMCSAIHHPVIELHRALFGGLSLGYLPEGEWRHLSSSEVMLLAKQVS